MNSTHIILIIIVLISGLAFQFYRFFLRRPKIDLDKAIEDAGYDYDKKQNIFYSRLDAWQRRYGYCKLYDDASVPLSLIFDCEPVRFDYGGKKWLIEFWKGQYGITTGCEIGVYTSKAPDSEDADSILYDAAKDEDMLPMALVLRKNKRVLFKRNEVHWWLTGFVLGEFSEPEELTMDIAITLKDRGMMLAFARKLNEMGYPGNEIKVLGNSIILTYIAPHSDQPRKHTKLLSRFSQWRNRFFCREYKRLTNNSRNIYEAADILKRKSPWLYNSIFKMGKPDKLFRKSRR